MVRGGTVLKAGGGVVLAVAVLLAVNHVPDRVTPEDAVYIRRILAETGNAAIREGAARKAAYTEQIALITAIQKAALAAAPNNAPLGLFQEREPKQVYLARKGWCYDKSRLVEKMAAYAGFETRHVAIYLLDGDDLAISALFTPGSRSHAVSGVLTKRGWIIVDSTRGWIALAADGSPLSIKQLAVTERDRRPAWHPDISAAPHEFVGQRFVYVIGLYSRHGFFYPPYAPVPNVNFSQLMQNISAD